MNIEINVNIEAKGLEAAILKLADAFNGIGGLGFEVEQHPACEPDSTSAEVVEEKTQEEAPRLTFMPEDVQEVVKEPVEDKTEDLTTEASAKPVTASEKATEASGKKEVTRQELFSRCTQLVQGKKVTMDFMAGLLQKFGVVSLPALAEDQLLPFWEELDKAGV